jgi:conjugative relaxase-like TrwC/TraI family protein
MLSMSVMSSGQAGYYLGLAREDYYLQGGEPPGHWFGSGARRLGLSGEVQPNHVYNLFDGLSPSGDRALVQLQRQEGRTLHRPGWDLTFSSPKSVSTLWSQASETTRRKIEEIHSRSVEAALEFLQDTAASTRRGKNGTVMERVGLVVATFEHSTSRALDPQLHTHALVLNVCVRDDGSTGALSSLDLFLSKMAAGTLYRAELAKGLQLELGLPIERERSWFEVRGVSRELMETFSTRRKEIQAELTRSGLKSAEAAAVAAIQTRSAKEGFSRSEMFAQWRAQGMSLQWSEPEVQRLLGPHPIAFRTAHESAEACERAVQRVTQDEAHFTKRDFVRCVAEEGQTRGLGAADIRQASSEFLARSTEIIPLGEYRGQERFTTRRMFAMEKELFAEAQKLAVDNSLSLHAETTMRVFVRHGSMSEEQFKAAWHLTVETGGFGVVSGMAGTGKTRMVEVAREAWEAEGYRVLGATVSARAARELAAGGKMETRTIARLLSDIEQRSANPLDSKTVLVLDEAGMVATPEMRRLVLACEEAGAKLVLIGDERQLPPIGPGAPMLELGNRFGRAELTDVRRQNQPWARQAVKDFATGQAEQALTEFVRRGLVTFSETRAASQAALVAAWRNEGISPQDSLLLAPTGEEVRALNRLAQQARQGAGELGDQWTEICGERVHLGDVVRFTKNKPSLGIANGDRATIESISEDGTFLGVLLDSGSRVTVEVAKYPHITLGYASTVHRAQGSTSLRAYILSGGPLQSREAAYVENSRAREQTRIFATFAEEGEDTFLKLVLEMKRSREKRMAHGVLREQEVDRDSGIDR